MSLAPGSLSGDHIKNGGPLILVGAASQNLGNRRRLPTVKKKNTRRTRPSSSETRAQEIPNLGGRDFDLANRNESALGLRFGLVRPSRSSLLVAARPYASCTLPTLFYALFLRLSRFPLPPAAFLLRLPTCAVPRSSHSLGIPAPVSFLDLPPAVACNSRRS